MGYEKGCSIIMSCLNEEKTLLIYTESKKVLDECNVNGEMISN